MNIWATIIVGLKEIWSHKFRSALTMLGIVLGVASLVGMSALVKGMENGMREAMQAVGGIEKVSVIQQELPPAQSHLADQVVGITMADVEALKQNATLTKLITPEMNMGRGAVVSRG
ncbi:MAG: ABC transporter permease, partial [Verrucomicrobia bacterium]|nr:ABC transporter permease [Verrucomicrobiota bacterium]